MNFNAYQKRALKTNQQSVSKGSVEKRLMIPLLGLAGETGTLLSEYKKRLRDGRAHELFIPYFEEELGDLLWYMSTLASLLNLNMDSIAKKNLKKIQERWMEKKKIKKSRKHLDARFPKKEQFPRKFEIEFCEVKKAGKVKVVIFKDEVMIGDDLTDNAYKDIGYRYHDVFHISYAAILGWSPVLRRLLTKKRKSSPKTDEVEDGARAALTEEAIAVFVYSHARDHRFYEGKRNIDYNILKIIKSLVSEFEVKRKSVLEWEYAILSGYKIFRNLRENNGGVVSVDLDKKIISYRRMNSKRSKKLKSIYSILQKHDL